MQEDISNRLQKISISQKEENITNLELSDIRISADECKRSLFGKIIGDRKARLFGLKKTMMQIWKLKNPLTVREIEPSFFQFIFDSKAEKNKVAAGKNWSFENQYIILKEWQEDLNANHDCFKEMDIWVQVSNIPLNCLYFEVGLKIGRSFKRVKNVTISTGTGNCGRYLRLLVTIDLSEPLLRCISIKLGDKIRRIEFKYEKLINLCYYCGRIGHLDRTCNSRLDDIAQGTLSEGQYGEWLKATEGIPSPRSNRPTDTVSTPQDASNPQSNSASGNQQAIGTNN